jgi:lactoylglutathione lyase
MNALSQIRQIDYTVIFTRDMRAMREFYESVMEFPVLRTLGDGWIEFGVGSNRLALRTYGAMFNDTPPLAGALSMQMAFRVSACRGGKMRKRARSQGHQAGRTGHRP